MTGRQDLDSLTNAHLTQAEVAKGIAARLLPVFEKKGMSAALEILSGAPPAPEPVPPTDLDPVACAIVLRKEVEQAVLRVIKGYADWLGCLSFPSFIEGEAVSLPECPLAVKAEIAKRYGPPLEVINLVLEDIVARPTELPPLGWIVNGAIRFDPDLFREWAKNYDWSESDGAVYSPT